MHKLRIAFSLCYQQLFYFYTSHEDVRCHRWSILHCQKICHQCLCFFRTSSWRLSGHHKVQKKRSHRFGLYSLLSSVLLLLLFLSSSIVVFNNCRCYLRLFNSFFSISLMDFPSLFFQTFLPFTE